MNARITDGASINRYKRNLNRTLGNMNSLQTRILEQRKFNRASQDPVGAARAINIRTSLANVDIYKTNLNNAKDIFVEAEAIMTKNLRPKVISITDKIVYGTNGDKGDSERKIIADEMRGVADSMIADLNNEYAGRKVFGGSNNDAKPFAFDGKDVTYNGVPVNSQATELPPAGSGNWEFNGKPITAAEATTVNHLLFPGSKPSLVDIGIGISYDANGIIDPTTALDISVNGVEITGSGTTGFAIDKAGNRVPLSNNTVQQAYDAANAIEAGDTRLALDILEHVKKTESNLLIGISKLGVKQQSVEYNLSKVKDDEMNLQAAQVSAELMSTEDIAESYTDYKGLEASYNAVLQMGTKVIPTSIFDFMR